jgi:hypothetical protein
MWFICHKIVIFLYENDDVLTFAMEKVDVELFSHLTRDFAFQKIKKRHDRTQKYLIIPVISKIFEVWHAFFFFKKKKKFQVTLCGQTVLRQQLFVANVNTSSFFIQKNVTVMKE